MNRLLFLLDKLNSRTTATLTLLWTLQFPVVRRYLRRVAIAGGVGVCVVLNFGLDLESERQRRRQVVPGLSRLLIVLVLASIWKSRSLDRNRLFLMGVALRVLPTLHYQVVRLLFAVTQQVRGPASILSGDGASSERHFDDSACSICLEDGPEWRNLCGHAFHRACLETWVARSARCPVCKSNVPTQPNIAAELLSFSASAWRRNHAVLAAIYWNS